ncbi:MAG: acyl-protein synthetase [Elusimicrobia bacterium]|nr:acyl-protein synthetase [Elusimicrobiota bacterium]
MNTKNIKTALPDFAKPLKVRSSMDGLLESRPFEYTRRSSALFVKAMRDALAFQSGHSTFLRAYFKLEKFSPAELKSEKDVKKIPFVFVSALKERDLTTLPADRIALELKSSGTSGQKSRIQLDRDSLARVRRMAWKVFEGLGLTDLEHGHDYMCFTYDPEVARDAGTAWTDKLLTGFTGPGEIFYAFRWSREKKDFYFDVQNSAGRLRFFEESGRRVRLLGFPAFALKLLDEFKKIYGRNPRLNPDSSVITGGGWKTLEDKAMDKKIYRKILANKLGIPVGNVRDLFGMVEHGVPYVDCRLGNFHIPNYGRVITRDPATLEPLGFGKTGLLQFMTPYLTSYPSLSLLSSDFGSVEEKCSCGIKGPVLRIKGRAGVKKLKGCAISATTML